MSVAEIKAQVSSSVEQAGQAITGCQGAKSDLDNALQQLIQTTQDTHHPKPGEAQGRWREAQTKLEEAMQLIESGRQACQEFINTI